MSLLKKSSDVPNPFIDWREREKLVSKIVQPSQKRVRGRYVYFWMDGTEIFYIGKGSGNRVTRSSISSPAERHRILCADFHWRIVRDQLTPEGAILLEATLIDLFQPICNRVRGQRRCPTGPLTLADVKSLRHLL